MRTFLWFMLVVMVSGDGETVDVTTFLNEDVLLPCTCTNKDLIWQVEKVPPERIYSDNKASISPNYTDRVETLFDSSTNNCSILLKNVIMDDMKTYSCRFNNETYQRKYVNLHVHGSKPCLQKLTNKKGFNCDVQSHSSSTTELQWTSLDGMSLEISAEYKISNNSVLTDVTVHAASTLECLTDNCPQSEMQCIIPEKKITSKENSKSQAGMLIGLALVIGLIMLVVFIFLRKQMNKSQMNPCCMDV